MFNSDIRCYSLQLQNDHKTVQKIRQKSGKDKNRNKNVPLKVSEVHQKLVVIQVQTKKITNSSSKKSQKFQERMCIFSLKLLLKLTKKSCKAK